MKLCRWCRSEITRSTKAEYCNDECSRNLRTSHRPREALSFIEVAEKIIQQDFRCAGRCGVYVYPRLLTQDHWIPVTSGGKHDRSNIRLLCYACNYSKGKKDGDQWLAENDDWIKEFGYSREVAAHNLLHNFIYHYKLDKRCRAIIENAYPPHKHEAEYAPILLNWITEQENSR